MEVVNPRSALLSNYEVLSLLRDLEADHLARTKTALRIKKEEEAAGVSSIVPGGGKDPTVVEIYENLRTVSVEAIQYLTSPSLPTTSQSPESISKLVKDLAPYDLTKAEKLQIVNLAPKTHVELYVIVEELEDRLPGRMDDVIAHVEESLQPPPTQSANTAFAQPNTHMSASMRESSNARNGSASEDEQWADAEEFDDAGEGAGVEGDLDMEED